MNNTEKCNNCKYYSQHFIMRNSKINKVNCGHCLNNNINYNKALPLKVCKYWENADDNKEERSKTIQKTLEEMCENLNRIKIILENDKKYNN